MCGIIGLIANNLAAVPMALDGLYRLQNRGYDSAGMAYVKDGVLYVRKYVREKQAHAVQLLNADPEIRAASTNIAIGHTRWGTHGPNTLFNAHPHYDVNNRFALVHNGIIENYLELKQQLEQHSLYGETDSEVVVKYIAQLALKQTVFSSLATLNTILKGSWAILLLDRLAPDKIFFMKHGSPLILGTGVNTINLLSELSALSVDSYYALADGEFGYVSPTAIVTQFVYTPIKLTLASPVVMTPDPYDHWTLKEIHDQPAAIRSLLADRLVGNKIIMPELHRIKWQVPNLHLIFLACGTSYHAARTGCKFFQDLRVDATIDIVDGADFTPQTIVPNRSNIAVLLSQSGETKDLYQALMLVKKSGLSSIGIINVENSLIARTTDICLYIKAGRENAVASTKSFTNQVVMLLLLALKMAPESDLTYIAALHTIAEDYHDMISRSMDIVPDMAKLFRQTDNCFVLGRNQLAWIAIEGALKMKEISYIHSEGMNATALKHGPFALLTTDVPVILLAADDQIDNITAEIRSRGSPVILISNRSDVAHADYHLQYYITSKLFPLLSVVPLQLLAYYIAVDRGNNPDFPRNLAKAVTVD